MPLRLCHLTVNMMRNDAILTRQDTAVPIEVNEKCHGDVERCGSACEVVTRLFSASINVTNAILISMILGDFAGRYR